MQATHRAQYPEDRYFLARAPIVRAHRALQIGYTLLTLVAGVDKFTHVLVDWGKYVAPALVRGAGIPVHQIVYVIGVVEIALALVVALAPRVGGYLVCVWLFAFGANLLAQPGSYGVVVSVACLAAGAYALTRIDTAVRFL